MSLINWIFDAYQHHRLDQTRQETARLRSEVDRIRTSGGAVDVGRLEDALGGLALAVKTIRRLAVEKRLCTEAEFQQMLRQVDQEDGFSDGKAPL